MALSLAAATLGAGALGAGASLFGAGKSASSAKKIAQMQINWERERAQNAIQWGVKDAEKAGLNKIIMAGGTGADTSSINPPMPDTSGYNSAGQIMSEAMKKSAEVKAIESQTDLNSATAVKTRKEAGIIEPKANAEIENLGSNTAVNQAKIQNLEAERKLTVEKMRTEAVRDLLKKQARKKWHSASKEQKEENKKIEKLVDQGKYQEAERLILLGF